MLRADARREDPEHHGRILNGAPPICQFIEGFHTYPAPYKTMSFVPFRQDNR